MHYNSTKLNFLRLFRTKNIFPDFFKNNKIIPTQYSYTPLTYSTTFNIFSRHTNLPEFRFCKPNLKSSLIMQSQLDTLLLVDTDFIDDKKINYICLTPPWHNWAGGGNLTTVTKQKHLSGLTSTRANRPAMSSSKR